MIFSVLFFYSMLIFYLAFSLILVAISGHYPGVWVLNLFAFIIFLPKMLITSIIFLFFFMGFGKDARSKTFVFLVATICISILIRLASNDHSSIYDAIFDRVFFCFFTSSLVSSTFYFKALKYKENYRK